MRTRQEEMVVAEVVAAVIWEKRDQPWEFTSISPATNGTRCGTP